MNDSLDRYRSYIESQFSGPPCHAAEAAPFITISRQAGAGGITIARLLSDLLQDRDSQWGRSIPWQVFDATLVDAVIQDHGLSQNLARFMNEDSAGEIEDILNELFGIHPQKWSLVRKTSETLLRLAQMGHVILVGRGAPVVTARLDAGLHVRLVGSVRHRMEHLKEHFGFDTVEAAEYIEIEDGGRRRYLKKYFNRDIDDPLLYDMIINTDKMPFEQAASVIAHAAKRTIRETADVR